MIRPGIASVTFRKHSVEQIVDYAYRAGLAAVEWGGDVHVPAGNIDAAGEARVLTKSAGLDVASYGSYYRVGCGGDFGAVAETAKALGAPMIRVWAGDRGSDKADAAWWETVVDDTRRIADIAGLAGSRLGFEFHGNTLTDTAQSAQHLLERIDGTRVSTYWQTPLTLTPEACMNSLEQVSPWLSNLHVFHYEDGGRSALERGADQWRRYLAHATALGGDRYALLEFVEGDEPDNLMRDAGALNALLAELASDSE